jgi:small subunit ribosomal protein S6
MAHEDRETVRLPVFPLSKDFCDAFPRASRRLRAGEQGKGSMALYEHVFLARQDVSSQQVDALVEQYKGVLEANGGKVGRVENWGLKSLTYRINKNRKAHYVLMDIDAPAPAVHEIERQMRINEDVLRYMTIAVEKHEDGPSAMMQKRDRDDRPRRDGDRPGGVRDASATVRAASGPPAIATTGRAVRAKTGDMVEGGDE